MNKNSLLQISAFSSIVLAIVSCGMTSDNTPKEIVNVTAFNFTAGPNMTAPKDTSDTSLVFNIVASSRAFNQSAVRQSSYDASLSPKQSEPYFDVEMALPTPPAYVGAPGMGELGPLAGLDEGVFYHNHSAGLEVMPDGDLLAVYFSTPRGLAESDTSTTFIQARKRYGSREWDMPEVFFATQGYNDQSALLWRDGKSIYFFGGGRDISDYVPFRMAKSEDNGAHWTFNVPILGTPATDYTAQPVSSAFRDPSGNIYFVCDADGSQSFLWMSEDEGVHWRDMGGRTGGRHSTVIPLDDKGNLLSIGGKNADVNGWTPQNISTDWGATWSESVSSPFPPLSTAQRPSLIRLASGNLLLVSDAYVHKYFKDPPQGWEYGNEPFAAISTDNGKTWRVKTIPYGLPHNNRARGKHTSLGYVTLRQGDDGMIHVLTTANANNLHFSFNEAWVWSDEPTVWEPRTSTPTLGELKQYTEYYLDTKGKQTDKVKSTWTARISDVEGYVLDGEMTDYYSNGKFEHKVNYVNGRKSGTESFWDKSGALIWTWERDLNTNVGVWTRYWSNGNKKVESTWNLLPTARDRDRQYLGYVAEGPSKHWDESGNLTAEYTFVEGVVKSE